MSHTFIMQHNAIMSLSSAAEGLMGTATGLTGATIRHLPLLLPSLLLALLAISYYWWYSVNIVHVPLVYGGKGGLSHLMVRTCSILKEHYRPTIWGWHHHSTTILRPLIQKHLPISFIRQTVTLSDGGIIALDWACNDHNNLTDPILLVIPGLTGDSRLNYVQHFVQDGLTRGYRVVVFNQRGMGGMSITTPVLVSASSVDDLTAVIDVIQSSYPSADIIGFGTSLGGIILVQYLDRMGEESKLTACINVSTPWDVKMTQPNMEENWINKKLYVDFLLSRVKDVVRRNSKILSKNPKINIDRVLQSTTMTEFDEHLTCPVHGFSSSDHYYSHCSIYNKLRRISVPFITVMSMDDPFAPADSIPIHEFERNPNTILILTRYGGHFGFIEGLYPNGPTWIDRLVGQFLATIKSELIR